MLIPDEINTQRYNMKQTAIRRMRRNISCAFFERNGGKDEAVRAAAPL